MERDAYAGPRGYGVWSVYYDTSRLRFYFEKIEGLKFRRKLRIRRYGETGEAADENSPVSVEIKQRVNRVTQKRRVILPYERALALCDRRERIDVDAFASVAQRQGPLVGEDDAALLRDSIDPLLDFDGHGTVLIRGLACLAVAADAQFAAELQPLDLLEVEAQTGRVVVDAPDAVAARAGIGVALHALVELGTDIADLIGRHEVFELVAVEGVKAARRAQSIGRSPLPALGPVVRSVLRLPTSFAAVGLACFESHVFGPLLIGCAVDLNLGRQPMNGLCPRCVAAVEAGSYAARGPGGAAGPAPGPERRSRPRLAPGT